MTKPMKKVMKVAGLLLLCLLAFASFLPSNQVAASSVKKTYTVKPSSKPYKDQYVKYTTYNEKTRQYYTLRSYLELLEKEGGGTLVLSKGTYSITNNLYVPSNVTIRLNDGVKVVKSMDTGTSKLAPSKSIFNLVSTAKSVKNNSVTKYNGEKNIKIIGKGSATIDLKQVEGAVAIVAGHNYNLTIEGISFNNMYGGNFIKIGGSSKVSIKKNTFTGHKATELNNNEAISIEVPDANSKAFPYSWSKDDKTVCKNIVITGNTFKKLERAIGSGKYSHGLYHGGIVIKDNKLTDITSTAIRVLNWSKASITANTLTNIKNDKGDVKAILVSGAKNITITKNEYERCDRPIQIHPAKNSGNGSNYAITYNVISEENKLAMLDNKLTNMTEYLIRYNKKYNEFLEDTDKWEIFDSSNKDFVVKPTDTPFQNYFTTFSTYNETTRQYYVLRSYLEQLERIGGGRLTLEKGTYKITGTLYVPSNVTITLEDGVTVQKIETTSAEEIKNSKSLFQLAAPSKYNVAAAYGGYKGESNIHFVGKGKAIINLNYVQDALGIIMGHNSNISVTGITFANMKGGHFIEVDASKNVRITSNKFLDSKESSSGIKEGINIDAPDNITKGFNVIWTNHDKTPNKDIVIESNEFSNLERAIGTHKYSEGKYHDNIQILNNTITGTSSDAIRIMNWSNTVMKGNHISNVMGSGDRAVLISGGINPTITDNYFTKVPRPIQIMPWKNSDTGSEYAITYNTITSEEINLMLKNYLHDVGETFIRFNKDHMVYDKNTEKYQYTSEYIK